MATTHSIRTSLSLLAAATLLAVGATGCAAQTSDGAPDEESGKTSSAILLPGTHVSTPIHVPACSEVKPNESFDLQKEAEVFTTPIIAWSVENGICGKVVIEGTNVPTGHALSVKIEDSGDVVSDDLSYAVYGYRSTFGLHCEGQHCWQGWGAEWEVIATGTANGHVEYFHSNNPHPHFVPANVTVPVAKDGGFTALRVAVRTLAGTAERASKVTFETE